MSEVIRLWRKKEEPINEHMSELEEKALSLMHDRKILPADQYARRIRSEKITDFKLYLDSNADRLSEDCRMMYKNAVLEFIRKGCSDLYTAKAFSMQLINHKERFFDEDGACYRVRQMFIDDSLRFKGLKRPNAFFSIAENYINIMGDVGRRKLDYFIDSVCEVDSRHPAATVQWGDGLLGVLGRLTLHNARVFAEEARTILDVSEQSGLKYLRRYTDASRKRFNELAV